MELGTFNYVSNQKRSNMMKVIALVLILLPWRSGSVKINDDELLISGSVSSGRLIRKRRQLGEQNLSLSSQIKVISNSIDTRQTRQILINEEFDLQRFLEIDSSLSIPTIAPSTIEPVTETPVIPPTISPTNSPTSSPSVSSPPTMVSTTEQPSSFVTPTVLPTFLTESPTSEPTTVITDSPSQSPTEILLPTSAPILAVNPTLAPMIVPTSAPTRAPRSPTDRPTRRPTRRPVIRPTLAPTPRPTRAPVPRRTRRPTNEPTNRRTSRPTRRPTRAPTRAPTRSPTAPPIPNRTLLEIVQTRADLISLNSAILLADRNKNTTPPYLVDILNQTTPRLTLFAPNNDAFALLNTQPWYPQYKTPPFSLHLYNLLAWQIATPEFNTSDFPLDNIPNLARGTIDVRRTLAGSYVVPSTNPSRATIVVPNIGATNGIAHVIDEVLWPTFIDQNALQAIQALGSDFSTFNNLITAAALDDTFANLTNATILAPSNDAIPLETERFLLLPENQEVLQAVLLYHVIDPIFNFASVPVPTITLRQTQQGENVLIGVVRDSGGVTLQVTFNDAVLSSTFFSRDNLGCVIGKIIIPPSLSQFVPRSLDSDPSPEFAEFMAMATGNQVVFPESTTSGRKRKKRKKHESRQSNNQRLLPLDEPGTGTETDTP